MNYDNVFFLASIVACIEVCFELVDGIICLDDLLKILDSLSPLDVIWNKAGPRVQNTWHLPHFIMSKRVF